MTEFEIRYHAMETALTQLAQGLVLEIARSKGVDGQTWIDHFKGSVSSEIRKMNFAGVSSQGDSQIRDVATSVVTGVADMAKDRFVRLNDEGLL